jgi:hypothetical protein
MNRKRQKRKIVSMLIPVALQSIGAVLVSDTMQENFELL